MTLAHWLHRTAQAHPQSPAAALGPKTVRRYRELGAAAGALATFLRRSGARRAKPIAIVSENRAEVIETLFACWWCGLTAAPIDPTLGEADLTAALAYADAEICFASPRASGAVMGARAGLKRVIVYDGREYRAALSCDEASGPAPTPTKPAAWLSFSDREPGQPPRAAVLSHGALMNMALSLLGEVDPVKPRDAQLHALPWWGPAGFAMLPALARGGVNVMPETGDFDPAELFENASRWRRASTVVSDHHLRSMIDCRAKMAQNHFRTLVVSGGGVSPELIQEGLAKFGPRLARIYGQCAFPLGLTRLNAHDVSARSEPFWATRIRSVGRPFLLTEIAIRGENSNSALGPDQVGRIFARGHHGMKGYWRDRRGKSEPGGGAWRFTGMLGSMDAHGYLSVLGDPEHLLHTRGGDRAPPEQLESALLDEGAAADVGATTRRNANTGEPEIVVFYQRRKIEETLASEAEAFDDDALQDAAESEDEAADADGIGADETDRPDAACDETARADDADAEAGPRPGALAAAWKAMSDAAIPAPEPFAIAARYELGALPRSANGRLQRAMLAAMAAERARREAPRRGGGRGRGAVA
ncbi:MAG: class I adenylate-forming enzyme family protein [Pseudomonadota bacterium]